MVIHPMVETFHLKSKQINLMVALDEKSEDQDNMTIYHHVDAKNQSRIFTRSVKNLACQKSQGITKLTFIFM